jgi:hypothetical protein
MNADAVSAGLASDRGPGRFRHRPAPASSRRELHLHPLGVVGLAILAAAGVVAIQLIERFAP